MSGLRERIRKLFVSGPCDRCGVEGGSRWRKGERVDERIVPRSLCSECKRDVFLYPWRESREWVPW